MSIQIISNGFEASKSFKDYINTKIDEAVKRYQAELISASVSIEKTGVTYKSVVSMRVKDKEKLSLVVTANSKSIDVNKSARDVIKRATKQIRRNHRKAVERNNGARRKSA